MLTRYIQEAMGRARFKWAKERTLDKCSRVLQEVLEEWLVLKIRDNDPIPRIGRAPATNCCSIPHS